MLRFAVPAVALSPGVGNGCRAGVEEDRAVPELRQNRFTKEWVIIATERAKRPEELVSKHDPKLLPSYVSTCPFCPGNEKLTPPEVLRVPTDAPDGHWAVRVVPNKFAALDRTSQPQRTV